MEIVPDQMGKHDALEEVLNESVTNSVYQSVVRQTILLIFNFWLMTNDLDVFFVMLLFLLSVSALGKGTVK